MALLFALTLPGCASQPSYDFAEDAARIQKLASEPTPPTWRAGMTWAFVELGKDGEIASSYVFRLTDEPQNACVSGDWKKLQLVRGPRTFEPAYSVQGRNLTVLLSTQLCDVYPEFSGVLSDSGFVGDHHNDHLMGSTAYGKVYGVPMDAGP